MMKMFRRDLAVLFVTALLVVGVNDTRADESPVAPAPTPATAQPTTTDEQEPVVREVTPVEERLTLDLLARNVATREPTDAEALIFDLMGRAEGGDPAAQNSLGLLYLGGGGLPRNPAEAFRLFSEAAAAGDAAAMNNLASCHERGIATEQSEEEAERWYRAAIEAGDPTARRNLADLLRRRAEALRAGEAIDSGQAAAALEGEALALLTTATDSGDAAAAADLGEWYQYGLVVERDGAKAAALYEHVLTIAPIADAQNNLAFLLQHGDGVPTDIGRAIALYEAAGDAGHAVARRNRGWIARYGGAAHRDPPLAREWFERAAELGDSAAMVEIGVMLDEGIGADAPDPDAAVQWFLMAAELDQPEAMYRLGILAEEGRGIPRNPTDAIDWYRRAAKLGSLNACFRLGEIFAEGTYSAPDPAMARAFFGIAARGGDAEAQRRLATLDSPPPTMP
jgi:TPR repeat protein